MDFSHMNYPPISQGHMDYGHGGEGLYQNYGQQDPMHMSVNQGNMPESEYKHQSSVLVEQSGVSTTAFDNLQELVWVGSNAGVVASYHGLGQQKYTAFRVHMTHSLIQLLPYQNGLFTLTSDNLRTYTRFGKLSGEFGAEDFHSMQGMMVTPNNTVLVGGHQPTVFELDTNTLQIVNKYEIEEPGVAIIKATNRHFLFGDTAGKITVRDPRSLSVEHTFPAHSGTLSDFDTYNNQVITCGFSSVRGNMQLDRFLMVYDLRMMRSIAPIQCSIEPYYLKYAPTYTSRIIVVSHSGHYQIMDTGSMTPNSMAVHPINASGPITAFDVSSSMRNISFGDASGCFHLYSVDGESAPVFNPYSQESEFADVAERFPMMNINDPMANYSSIPMHYPGQGTLLSDWPAAYTQRTYHKQIPIDQSLLNNMKMNGNIGYAKVAEGSARQFPYATSGSAVVMSGGHKGQTRGTPSKANKRQVPPSPIGRVDDPFAQMPKHYRKVEIKYSKLGVEDFDFRHYNKTNFAGLETHIPNAYCNSMLQVLYFIEPLRSTLMSHLCNREFCLACELGFLFHMLDITKGMTCQASNFLRAFRTVPEASALGLNLGDDDEASKANLARIIQNWSRFVLQQIHTETTTSKKSLEKSGDVAAETEENKDEKSVVQRLFGTSVTNRLTCKCGETNDRHTETLMFNMIYPEAPVDVPSFEFPRVHFSQLVGDSMNASQAMQAWCEKCSKYQPHNQKRVLKNLPDIIGLNCQVDNDTTLDFWKHQIELLGQELETTHPQRASQQMSGYKGKTCRYGNQCTRGDCHFYHEGRNEQASQGPVKRETPAWVPLGLSVKISSEGIVTVCDIENPFNSKAQGDGDVVYELLASVAHIKEQKTGGNLVAHVNVGECYHQRKEGITTTQFYLFNDFSIVDIEKEEAVKFNMEWKWPCALFYVKRRFTDDYETKVNNPFNDYETLIANAVVNNRGSGLKTLDPTNEEGKLQAGDVVGIDAEFVSLNQEESELRSDGTKSTLKPPQMSVARVTCIRMPKDGEDGKLVPFMDEYISTQEEVVDYLTQFSGIKPGDLDATQSSKHLTTLKSMYLRLRYMVDKGVIFVGHGLKKDFRVINLVVPPKQVVDTVELFYLPRQRMISLKFLAWYYLGETIQSETHDSTEDTQTALKLYKKYKAFEVQGKDVAKLAVHELYENGRLLSWKIPEDAPHGVPGINYQSNEQASSAS